MDIEQHDTKSANCQDWIKIFENLTLSSKIDVALVSLSDVLGLNIYRKSSVKLPNNVFIFIFLYYGLKVK